MLAAPMEPQPTSNFSLAGAGSVLIGSTAAVIVLCILIGWALRLGRLGLPRSARSSASRSAIFMTYRRYGHAL